MPERFNGAKVLFRNIRPVNVKDLARIIPLFLLISSVGVVFCLSNTIESMHVREMIGCVVSNTGWTVFKLLFLHVSQRVTYLVGALRLGQELKTTLVISID